MNYLLWFELNQVLTMAEVITQTIDPSTFKKFRNNALRGESAQSNQVRNKFDN